MKKMGMGAQGQAACYSHMVVIPYLAASSKGDDSTKRSQEKETQRLESQIWARLNISLRPCTAAILTVLNKKRIEFEKSQEYYIYIICM